MEVVGEGGGRGVRGCIHIYIARVYIYIYMVCIYSSGVCVHLAREVDLVPDQAGVAELDGHLELVELCAEGRDELRVLAGGSR